MVGHWIAVVGLLLSLLAQRSITMDIVLFVCPGPMEVSGFRFSREKSGEM